MPQETQSIPAPTGTNLDVKETAASSATGSADALSSEAGSQSAAGGGEKPPATFEETIADVVQSQSSQPAKENEGKGPASGVQKVNATEEEAAGGEGDAAGEQAKAEETKGPVPYERFDEVNKKFTETNRMYEEAKPIVETHNRIVDYCRTNEITEDDFKSALEIAALVNVAKKDPTKAAEVMAKLNPVVEFLQSCTGERLPNDLAKEVEAGDLTLERAQELNRLRVQTRVGQLTYEQRQKADQQRSAEQYRQSLMDSVQGWTVAKQKSDPDYKPRTADNEPLGKFELVHDRFVALMNQMDQQGRFVNQAKTAQEMTALLERAYVEVTGSYQGHKAATRRPISRNGSPTTTTKTTAAPKTIEDAMNAVLAEHGVSL